MYLVDFPIFQEFVSKNGLDKNQPIIEATPFILEYKRDGVMMAKIEMSSIEEFKFLQKYPATYNPQKSKNKYWIRGNEWIVINGQQIQELNY
ncbi:MAG: hypothetical protein P4L28_10795 [Paludibacteraceae bacterium]|nr:hypothetical protein [Paludibacteraceae bacterium]